MSPTNKKVQFQIGGLLKLEKVGDYLQLENAKIGLVFKDMVPGLNSRKISSAHVIGLSDTGTHLILENICVKRYFFFSRYFDKSIVPVDKILTVRILEK